MGDKNEKDDEKKVLVPKTGGVLAIGESADAYIMMTLAPQWFDDAMREATSGFDLNSRRREICFLRVFYVFPRELYLRVG